MFGIELNYIFEPFKYHILDVFLGLCQISFDDAMTHSRLGTFELNFKVFYFLIFGRSRKILSDLEGNSYFFI